MRRVVDASALLDAVLPTPQQGAALAALRGYELWAPAILDREVTSALWRLERTQQITKAEARRALDSALSAPIRRLASEALALRAWQLRASVRISDGFYVAAAHALDADLVTSDGRLARAPSLGVTVTLLR